MRLTDARREALGGAGQGGAVSNAGLALARYLPQQGKPESSKDERPLTRYLKLTAESPVPDAYRPALERWRGALAALGAQTRELDLTAPLAVGLGNEHVTENGLTLHHTYGTPLLPGSAVKGLVRRGAALLLKEGGISQDQFDTLFGTAPTPQNPGGSAAVGAVDFLDAWLVSAPKEQPLKLDTVTVHHQKYYQSRGRDVWPTDFDDPTPVPFLVVRPGCRFLFAVRAPDEAWASFTLSLLGWCLENLGAGGKTNAGYGRFRWSAPAPGSAQPTAGTAQPTAGTASASGSASAQPAASGAAPVPSEPVEARFEQRNLRGGGVEVVLHTDHGRVTLNQQAWQQLQGKLNLTGSQREALRKGRLRGMVVLAGEAGRAQLGSVERVFVDGAG
jgi:CRISPR-associated protein Cmr6